jgi:hypothetical protein
MVVDLLRCGVDGSDGWRLCFAMNGSLFRAPPFTELIGFDLGSVAAHRMGGPRPYWCPLNSLEPTFTSWLIFCTCDKILFNNCMYICH